MSRSLSGRPARRVPRHGIAIPFVVSVCIVVAVALLGVVSTSVEVHRQNLGTLDTLQSQFMANAAIQHALLKLKVLPNEIFDASSYSRGYCPFFQVENEALLAAPPTIAADDPLMQPLTIFKADMVGNAPQGAFRGRFGEGIDDLAETNKWYYEVTRIKALNTSWRRSDNTKVLVVEVEGTGWTTARVVGRPSEGAKPDLRQVSITKTLKIERTATN